METNSKISFGVDFLNIMGNADLRSGQQGDMNGFLLARLLLVTEWGLTAEEQDAANQLFWEQVSKNSLDDLGVVAKRFILHLKKDPIAGAKFLTEMITINYLDGQITDGEKELTLAFANELDFRKSEVDALVSKAVGYAVAYGHFGDNFAKSSQ